jgi:hypothetical protein
MRSSIALASLLAVLALCACKKDTVVARNESEESVARKVAASDLKPQPGRWESRTKLEKLDLPNVPPQAKAMMDKQMQVTQTFTSCLTPEQVSQPNGGFFQKGAENCKYDHFVMAGGSLDARMTCNERAGSMTMTLQGRYTPTDYAIDVTTQGEMQPGMPMSMKMSVAARRVGECTGKEDR